MDNELMNLRDVARHLRLTEKTVSRLAKEGQLPALKLARGWRFSRTAVDEWQSRRPSITHALPSEATGVPEPLTLAGAMDVGRMNLLLRGVTKDAVLRELVRLVVDPTQQRQAEVLFQALKAREDLCSTCVNEGIAIPHARNALVGLVTKPLLAYGRHPQGVEFGALDRKPVQHFFLLCAPTVREHLHLLARLSRILHNPGFRDQLTAAQSAEEVIARVRAAEQTIPAQGAA
jgi:excisionase family DNA binding protein